MALCAACDERLTLRNSRRAACGIPARHLRLRRWENLKPPHEGADRWRAGIKALQIFIAAEGSSILALLGSRGSGKTQLAAVAVWQSIEAGRSARMIGIVRLLVDLKDAYRNNVGDTDWLNRWARPWLLVIDEIAERLESNWSATMLTALIDERYAAMRPTILVGNVAAENFAEVVGPSIASRAAEGGGLILCDWPSFRMAPKSGGHAENSL